MGRMTAHMKLMVEDSSQQNRRAEKFLLNVQLENGHAAYMPAIGPTIIVRAPKGSPKIPFPPHVSLFHYDSTS